MNLCAVLRHPAEVKALRICHERVTPTPQPRDASCLPYCAVAGSKSSWRGLADDGAKPDRSRNTADTYPVEIRVTPRSEPKESKHVD